MAANLAGIGAGSVASVAQGQGEPKRRAVPGTAPKKR
jgi:hypothetical protein